MQRREFLKAATAATFASTAEVAASPLKEAVRKPLQVIFMMTDTTRRDMLNCYAHTGLHTPNLDRLAAEGIRFEHAYTCQPVCAPARSTLFTGTYPHTNGVWGNSMPLGQTVHNVAEYLSGTGVTCGHIGKWHLDGGDYFGTGKPQPGWEPAVWYDMKNYLDELTPEDRIKSRETKTAQDPKLAASFTFAHRCSSRAIQFIAQHKHDDFLLVISYDEPHDPSVAPVQYRNQYKDFTFPTSPNYTDTLQSKPEEQRVWSGPALDQPPAPSHNADFFAALTFVDSEIGRVIDCIDRDTPGALVFYTSDHGDMLGSHRLNSKGPAMYQEVTNIPFLVRWSGEAAKNVSSEVLVSHIDVSGTLLEFFGQDVPKTFEGGSMLSSIKDPRHRSREHCYMEWGRYEVDHDGFGGFQPIRCITDGRYKLSIHLLTTDEFYDLESDPQEMMNLIDSAGHAAVRNKLHDELLNWMDVSRDPFRGYYWGRREWRRDYPVSYANHGMTRQRENDRFSPRQLDYATGLPMKTATRAK
jgi:arylsulfatase A-like enzyme